VLEGSVLPEKLQLKLSQSPLNQDVCAALLETVTEYQRRSASLPSRMSARIHIGKAKKDEPEMFGEAKHATRNVAQFCGVCGKRPAGPTVSSKSSSAAGVTNG